MRNLFQRIRMPVFVSILIIGVILGNAATQQASPTPEPTHSMSDMSSMGGMETVTDYSVDDLAPLVRGLYEGEEVLFLHTEASDETVASLLTEMMGPDVILVPSLAEIPTTLLGNVYVFTNGIAGGGPMGFQPDIFDSIPGDEDYTPLRQLNRVRWADDSTPRLLNSVSELRAAETAGEVDVELSSIVVNMPILVWPGGQR